MIITTSIYEEKHAGHHHAGWTPVSTTDLKDTVTALELAHADAARLREALEALRPACTGCDHLLHAGELRECGAEGCNCHREHRNRVALYAEVRWGTVRAALASAPSAEPTPRDMRVAEAVAVEWFDAAWKFGGEQAAKDARSTIDLAAVVAKAVGTCGETSEPTPRDMRVAEAVRDFERWPVVLVFARAMMRKLDEHAPKKGSREGWQNDDPGSLWGRIGEESNELWSALRLKGTKQQVLDEAADVANMALMTADAAGAIDLDAVVAKAPEETA